MDASVKNFGVRIILLSVETRIAFTDHVSEVLVTCTYSPAGQYGCPISDFHNMIIIGKQILNNNICAISKFEVKKKMLTIKFIFRQFFLFLATNLPPKLV